MECSDLHRKLFCPHGGGLGWGYIYKKILAKN